MCSMKNTISVRWRDTVGSISGKNSMQPLFLRKEKSCFHQIIMSLSITCSLFTDVWIIRMTIAIWLLLLYVRMPLHVLPRTTVGDYSLLLHWDGKSAKKHSCAIRKYCQTWNYVWATVKPDSRIFWMTIRIWLLLRYLIRNLAISLEINGTIPIVRTVMTRISSGRLPKLIISVWITVSLIIAFTVLSIITNAIRRICWILLM